MVWKWDIFSNINRDLVILFGDIEVSFGADLTLIDLVKKTIIPYSAVQNFGDPITKKTSSDNKNVKLLCQNVCRGRTMSEECFYL